MTDFNGALDRYLDPPYESERDALNRERWEEEVCNDARGEKCADCLGETSGVIDEGVFVLNCIRPLPDGDVGCGWQRTETMP